ncbi:MAG TPA: carbon monoxide dehydrogenase subunit G [Vicinamibacteria bacterium]
MHFEGAVNIRAPRERAWRFLTDPAAVSRCAPGLESVEVVVPGQKFRAVTSVGFGTVRVIFSVDAEWLELEPPARARMKLHGTAPGSAVDATSEMLLTDGAGGTTDLKWRADVTVLGTIASIAARLMGGVTQRLTDAFFDCVRKQIEGGPA